MDASIAVWSPVEIYPVALIASGDGHAWGLAAAAAGLAAVTVLWVKERRRRVDLESRLKETEARAKLAEGVINTCPEGILMMDPHNAEEPLAIIACNDHACMLHQMSREEMVGRSVNILEARSDWWPDTSAVKVLVDGLRRNGLKRGEALHRRKDGSWFPLEFSNSLIVVDGREYVLGFDRDITARKAAEEQLRASEERFRLIMETSPVSIQLLDPHDAACPMRIVAANRRAAEMHGVGLDEFIGRSIGDFEPNPMSAEASVAKAKELKKEGVMSGEGVHLHRDGHEFPIEYTCALTSIDGRELIIGCDHDVSERKRMDEELAESRRLRAVGAMVGGVAHEFNNLLTPILLYMEQATDPDARPILQAVEQARELTRRILTFGRRPEGRPSACDASAAVRECVELMAKTIDRRIELVTENADGCVVGMARNDLSQILINLLLNARDTLVEKLDAGGGAGWTPRIVMSVSRAEADRPGAREERVRIRVTDNGLGISREVRERVFEPFFTTKPPGKGTGLGLATVWHLVRGAGGQVALGSEEGEGSTLDIFLPSGDPATAAEGAEREGAGAKAAMSAASRGTILLVEDNDFVSGALIPMLRARGYAVTHHANGADAQAAILAEPERWDRVLTDLNLPGVHGAELARRIRVSGYTGKIVAYSGMIEPEAEAILRAAGVSAILQKPFPMTTLWEALD